jgi:hypothetical protein
MIDSGQNVKRLLAFEGRPPRRPGQVAALRRPEAGRPESHGVRRHRGRSTRVRARRSSTGCFILRTPVNKREGKGRG